LADRLIFSILFLSTPYALLEWKQFEHQWQAIEKQAFLLLAISRTSRIREVFTNTWGILRKEA